MAVCLSLYFCVVDDVAKQVGEGGCRDITRHAERIVKGGEIITYKEKESKRPNQASM